MPRTVNASIRKLRRMAPIAIGVLALLAGFAILQFALASRSESTLTPLVRSAEATANRGGLRSSSPVTLLAGAAPTTAIATAVDPTTVAPTTVAPTTTLIPTTTSAPTTTTIAVPPTTRPLSAATSGNVQSGKASYYDYKPGGCAHKTLPKGTVVTVTNVSNGKSTTCVVKDRGPFIVGRIIDLETRVFTQVSTTSAGVFNARISW